MKKKFRFQWGAFLMLIVFGGSLFLLFLRILQLQIIGNVDGRELAAIAKQKYARQQILQGERGDIVDRNGEIIAMDTHSYRLIAIVAEREKQNRVTDARATAKVLARHIEMPEENIYTIIQNALDEIESGENPNRFQVEFGKAGRALSIEQAEALKEDVQAEELKGITLVEERQRYYPNGIFASHLIGYAVKELNEETNEYETVGKMGIENTYDSFLKSEHGKMTYNADGWNYILLGSKQQIQPPKNGSEVKLTLDNTLQNFIEDAMAEMDRQYAPKKATVVLAHAKTGEILGMSQRPTFDPVTREGITEGWLNEVIENTIEPGSTMKMFTLAAAIEEGKWRPNDYFKSGHYKVFDRTIYDVYKPGWGTISFLEGFQRSSNVSMAYLLERIGDRRFIEYVEDFGFGQKVGIDLPNEASGIILDNYPAERLTTSYGQGSTVTPLQMIQAATAIANDGKMMKPFIIKSVYDPNEEKLLKLNEPEQKGTPISAETARQVREVLASTITAPHGTGRSFALTNYDVGGKTGTAEIPRGDGTYMSGGNNYLFSFLGMAPIDDPELIMFVSVQQPTTRYDEYGSAPVAKLFTTIMESSLKYMNVKPKEVEVIDVQQNRSYMNETSDVATETIRAEGLVPIVIGEGGVITDQYPSEGTELIDGSYILLKTEGATTLPNFEGWSKKMILAYKVLSGLDIRITGDGFVVGQNLSSGTVVTEKEPIVLQLAQPKDRYEQSEEVEQIEEE